MKVGVLTFHRCINYGSYWQARCLVDGVRAMGHDAVLLDHDAPEIRLAEWRCAFQPQLPRRTPRGDYRRYASKARRFLAAFDALPQSLRFALDAPADAGDYDLILVGSDEVWNFRHPWYGGKAIFFGEGLRAGRIASYAASFGNHDAAHGIHPDWAARLRAFSALSVRDENSRQLVSQGVGYEPAVVLDPCLQFPPPREKVRSGRSYLALYGHSFPDWFARAIRRHADARGLPIASIGYQNDWADEHCVEAGPNEFSSLIGGAQAVATNFFHGCVFALHHRRPFVCAPSVYRLNKVRDLTAQLGADRHLVSEATADATYAALLDQAINPLIEKRIASLRARSTAYLEAVLA
jgi:hypothetical protein